MIPHAGAQYVIGIFCTLSVALFAVRASAQEYAEPTPEMIEKAMGPNEDTVRMGGPTVRVRIESRELVLGGKCKVSVEVCNTLHHNILIYIPGLLGRVQFSSAEQTRRAFGLYFGRGPFADPRRNFMVLTPGRYYGQAWEWDAVALGKLVVTGSYANTDSGKEFGLPAWQGRVEGPEGAVVNIVGGPKAIAAISKLVSSDDVWTRAKGFSKLASLGDPAGIPILLRGLDDEGLADGVFVARRAAAYSIQKFAHQNLGLPANEAEFDPRKDVVRVREWAENYLKVPPVPVGAEKPDRQ